MCCTHSCCAATQVVDPTRSTHAPHKPEKQLRCHEKALQLSTNVSHTPCLTLHHWSTHDALQVDRSTPSWSAARLCHMACTYKLNFQLLCTSALTTNNCDLACSCWMQEGARYPLLSQPCHKDDDSSNKTTSPTKTGGPRPPNMTQHLHDTKAHCQSPGRHNS